MNKLASRGEIGDPNEQRRVMSSGGRLVLVGAGRWPGAAHNPGRTLVSEVGEPVEEFGVLVPSDRSSVMVSG